jgi:hypothetical protein
MIEYRYKNDQVRRDVGIIDNESDFVKVDCFSILEGLSSDC